MISEAIFWKKGLFKERCTAVFLFVFLRLMLDDHDL